MLGSGYNGLELLLWWNMILGNGEWKEPAHDYVHGVHMAWNVGLGVSYFENEN